jgi:hypothetical protein
MGLLDAFLNPSQEQQQGLLAMASQLLQAGGPSTRPVSFGQALGGGLQAYQGAMEQARQRKLEEEQARQMAEMRALQMQSARGQLGDAQREREQRSALEDALRSNFLPAGTRTAQALPGGPTVANAGRIGEFQPGLDQAGVIRALMEKDPVMAHKLAKDWAPKPTEFGETPRVGTDETGKPFTYLVGKNGEIKKLDGVLPRDELKLANLGDRELAYNPFQLQHGQALARGVSPDSRLSASVAMRGQNMTDARQREANAISQEANQTQIINDPIRGPLLVNKGTGAARPAVGVDGKPVMGEVPAKKLEGAKSVEGLLDQVDKLLGGATGSYLGATVDQGARLFGKATQGAQNIAQLKVLEAGLVMNMPRLEGPQSDRDTALYKEAAAQIGDPTVPVTQKQAAMQTIRAINDRALGKPRMQVTPEDIGALLEKYAR